MGNVIPDRFFWALPPTEADAEGEVGTSADDGGSVPSEDAMPGSRRVH
jgi:hydroxymethylpyrimidine/phosphomethylpyrimidine kinase